jgi:hypothetical protein
MKNIRVSHHRFTGSNRPSLRNGFTAYLVLSPVIGLFCHRRQRDCPSNRRQLDTSVEMSGPHDFAVRRGAPRLETPLRPSHPAPNVRDDREAPLLEERGTAETSGVDLPDIASRKFLVAALDKFALRDGGV